nr:MAG TPA: hypothetical protein [Caudoviricetes sp.]
MKGIKKCKMVGSPPTILIIKCSVIELFKRIYYR